MYEYLFSKAMTQNEQRDFVESIECDVKGSKYLTVMADTHDAALYLSNILSQRHESNDIAVVHIYGSMLRIFSDPSGEKSLMMFVVIKS